MSEKQPEPQSKESLNKALESAAEQLESLEKKSGAKSKEVKEAKEKHSAEKIKAKQELEQALSGAEKAPVAAEKADKKREPLNRGVKKQQYKATMRRVESKLPKYQRTFSKVIHNPTVDAVSNVAAKTVARPSGLAGGAIMAFAGLTLLYFNAINIGFEYNAGSAFLFFVSIGWLSGILIEYIFNALKRLAGK